jgi:hypothetical protein
MGKAIGLLLAVVAIWVTVEVYTQGVGNAFGGRLAAFTGDGGAPHGTTAQRVGAAVGRAHQEHDERYDKLLTD